MAGVHTLSQQAELGICTFYSTLRFIIHNGDLWEYKHPKKREREREKNWFLGLGRKCVITFAES